MKSLKATGLPESPGTASNASWLERHFRISKHGSSIGQEVRGGLVTFFAMAYIIALNPLIIGTATDVNGNLISGAPKFLDEAMTQVDPAAVGASIGMVAAGTAFMAGIMTILMGVVGRFPMGLATGLGLNALVAYTLAPKMTWPQAMGLVVWEGILIAVLVLTGFRTAVFKAVPKTLRTAISVGIGLFIAFVGLINAGVVRKPAGSPPVELGISGSLTGWPILVFVIGLGLLIALHVLKVKGAMLISIVAATVTAIIIEAVGHVGAHVGAENPSGWALNVPSLTNFTLPDLGLLFRVDMVGAFYDVDGHFSFPTFLGLMVLVFSLLLADFFDTLGTVVAVGAEGGILDERGEPPHLRGILLADSLAALLGGLGSTSSSTSYIESTAGVAEGARTGVASIVTGVLFLLAIFLSPLTNMVPSEAVAPVLVVVGFLMMQQVGEIDWHHLVDAIPAFITIVLMPFSYSISVGIGAGFVVFIALKIFQGKARHVHPLMWVVGALFVVYFASDVINRAISGAA